MSSSDLVMEERSSHSWMTQIPNVVFELGLTGNEFLLYCLYKKVAGDHGACWMSTKNLSEKIGVCKRTLIDIKKSLTKPRDELEGNSLISVTERFDEESGKRESDLVIINCIWGINFQISSRGCKKVQGGGAKSYRGGVQKSAHKEDPLKNIPLRREERVLVGSEEPPIQPSLSSLSSFFLEESGKHHKHEVAPSLVWWESLLTELTEENGLSKDKAKNIISWAYSSKFWIRLIATPDKFVKHFDTIYLQYQQNLDKKKNSVAGKEKVSSEMADWTYAIQQEDDKFPEGKKLIRTASGIEVRVNYQSKFINFTDTDFKEKIIRLLDSWKVTIKGINDGLMAT